MKKLIAFLLCAVMLTVMFVSVSAEEDEGTVADVFSDVGAEEWYTDAVQYVYDRGMMVGCENGNFGVDMPLTRAQAVTILYAMAGKPDNAEKECVFTDVADDAWYRDAVIWACSHNVTYGYTYRSSFIVIDKDGNCVDPIWLFGSNDFVTRADFTVMLLRYVQANMLKLPELSEPSDFVDANDIPRYASAVVDILYRAGVICGRDDGRFDPKASLTRAEAAVIFKAFLEKAEEQSLPLLEKNGYYLSSVSAACDELYVLSKYAGRNNISVFLKEIRDDAVSPDRVCVTCNNATVTATFGVNKNGLVYKADSLYLEPDRVFDFDEYINAITVYFYYGDECEDYTVYIKPYIPKDNRFIF